MMGSFLPTIIHQILVSFCLKKQMFTLYVYTIFCPKSQSPSVCKKTKCPAYQWGLLELVGWRGGHIHWILSSKPPSPVISGTMIHENSPQHNKLNNNRDKGSVVPVNTMFSPLYMNLRRDVVDEPVEEWMRKPKTGIWNTCVQFVCLCIYFSKIQARCDPSMLVSPRCVTDYQLTPQLHTGGLR